MEKIIDLKKRSSDEIAGEKAILDWEIEERANRERSWQIGIIIFLVLCLAFVLWQKNYFGFLLVLVISVLLLLQPRKKKTYFAILKRGARRGKEIFPWYNLESFWIFDNPPQIYFKSKKKHLPYHVIFPLPGNHIEKARKIISGFIPEKEEEKNIFDILSERLGL